MSGYVRVLEIKAQFDGQEVRLTLSPLLRADLFIMQGLAEQGSNVKVLEHYAASLPKYIKSLDLVDAAGAQVSAGELAESAYFTPLVLEVMTTHMEKAVPSNPLPHAALPGGSSG